MTHFRALMLLSLPTLCCLKAKTQRILGMVTKLSSEDTLLIQHHVHRERTYSALYLYGMQTPSSSDLKLCTQRAVR